MEFMCLEGRARRPSQAVFAIPAHRDGSPYLMKSLPFQGEHQAVEAAADAEQADLAPLAHRAGVNRG